ncbi:hypothetical protein MCSV2_50151 [Mucispirillum schaedleri ASF457]|nr:hypothetical protein MCSV2_50151 [Mucispirillum schaedleri ASF457]
MTILHNRLNCIFKIYDYLYIFNRKLKHTKEIFLTNRTNVTLLVKNKS